MDSLSFIFVSFNDISGTNTLYCVVPPTHEKNLMLIKGDIEAEQKEKTFQRQVCYGAELFCELNIDFTNH